MPTKKGDYFALVKLKDGRRVRLVSSSQKELFASYEKLEPNIRYAKFEQKKYPKGVDMEVRLP